MGPITSGLGEVLMWTVAFEHPGGKGAGRSDGALGGRTTGAYLDPGGRAPSDPTAQAAYLREVQDWIVRPQMRAVPGVAGVDSIGGFEKQFVVQPDPTRMAAYRRFVQRARQGAGGGQSGGRRPFHRAGRRGLPGPRRCAGQSVDEIAAAAVAHRGGAAVLVRDLAEVRIGGALRTGAASQNGEEVVVGTVLMLTGENSRAVAKASGEKLAEIARSLPPGVALKVVYDRSKLVRATIWTVEANLIEGALLVIVVLFLLLGNFRAAPDHRPGDPAVDADDRHRHEQAGGVGQPDEPGRAGLRPDRRRRGDHRREQPCAAWPSASIARAAC